MPIEKVPVIHRFGIISHTQRLELQERLLKQSYLETYATRKSTLQSRNPLEVTDEFILQYNATEDLDDREKLDATAHKIMHRIKRRAGLKDGGSGEHVDLPLAWTELSQLAQCKGKIQEECLNVLITSLDQAPLDRSHVPALFFLAETTLYWLRTDAVHQPFLRTGEIKLLRMGELCFVRIFYHHMVGQLQGHTEFKNRLFTYLDGFADSQEAYSPYPNALLCVRYINEVGKIIIGDCNTEAGEIKEGDRLLPYERNVVVRNGGESPLSCRTNNTSDENRNDLRNSVIEMFHEAPVQYEETRSSHSAAISSSVHDLSPTLWHGLDVWRCVHNRRTGLEDATRALGSCGMGLAFESWVDGVTAMQVLGDAAKNNLQVLRTVQNLARGVKLPPRTPCRDPSGHHAEYPQENDSLDGSMEESSPDRQSEHKHAPRSLSDIFEKSETAANSAAKSRAQKPATPSNEASPERAQSHNSGKTQDLNAKQVTIDALESSPIMTLKKQQTKDSLRSQPGTEYTTQPNTAWRADVGSESGLEGRASQTSTMATFGNTVHTDLAGLHGWHWEVAVWYTDTLADICLHGNTSTIQKAALVGTHKELGTIHKTALRPECPMKSAGLLDLVYFRAARETNDGSSNDWSWRVRYSAIQGLVKICRCCGADSTKEGMRTVAWTTLVKAHSLERDQRVLEALKVGQVESNIENLLSQHMTVAPETIGAKVAAGLSVLYLPPLPSPVEAVRKPLKQKVSPPKQTSKSPRECAVKAEAKKPLRTSLRQEIMLATASYEPTPTFSTRTNFDLKRIVEDQWRKQLQTELTEEEEERRKELEKRQDEDEARRRQIEAQRREKLGPKYKGRAYQCKDLSRNLSRRTSSGNGRNSLPAT